MRNTSTMRSQKFRKKLREDTEKYNLYKSKDRERKRVQRGKPKEQQDPAEIARQKQNNRDRVRKHRMKKRLQEKVDNEGEENVTPYSTPQALGKAVGKVKPHLPKSPRKRKAVVVKLASAAGLQLSKKKQKINLVGNKITSPELVAKVKAFYMLDSISRQAPGKKDFVTSKDSTGKKEYLQKRHMMLSLKETLALFLKKNQGVKISLSKFSSLRPKNVLLSSEMPANVCLCSYHENIRLICDSLNKEISTFPKYSGEFVDNFVCNSSSEDCMLGKCDSCPNFLDAVRQECEESLEEPIIWHQWERVEVVFKDKNQSKNSVKKMRKIQKEGSLDDLLSSLEAKIPSFLEHVFIKRQQSKYFEDKLNNLGRGEAVIQIDFAENYTCKEQDEIQAAHWHQEQVTIFTVAVWTKSSTSDNNVCDTHTIISDDLAHDKMSVAVFMHTVLDEFVKKRHPEVTKAFIFSDGPSSQFKNKYIVSFLNKLNDLLSIQWNYFATSHGKGVVDGIGGTIKRQVWKALATRKALSVSDAKSFYKVAKQLQSSINVYMLDKQQILKKSTELCLATCFSEAATLPGISKFHCIEPQGDGFVECRQYSYQKFVHSKVKPSVFFDSDQTDSESCDEVSIGNDSQDLNNKGFDEPSDDDNSYGDGCCSKTSSEDVGTPAPNVQQALPMRLLQLFNNSTSIALPNYIVAQVDAIMNGVISFKGSPLIGMNDLKSLLGSSQAQVDNWLCNFVIDQYLTLIKLYASSEMNVNILTLPWEIFERGKPDNIANLLKQKDPLKQDMILIPCNQVNSNHWYLLAILPKEKMAIVLDSMAKDHVKPTVHASISKVATILSEIDPDCDVQKWVFACNAQDEIPQQSEGNQQDCGVFACLYARCLVGLGPIIDEASIPAFRKSMIFSLHRGSLLNIPVQDIALEQYYAVDYVNNFYIGRAISVKNKFIKFKFLHRVGSNKFGWPKRDDIDEVHLSCVFFGPVGLENFGPFVIPLQQEIEKLFNATR